MKQCRGCEHEQEMKMLLRGWESHQQYSCLFCKRFPKIRKVNPDYYKDDKYNGN